VFFYIFLILIFISLIFFCCSLFRIGYMRFLPLFSVCIDILLLFCWILFQNRDIVLLSVFINNNNLSHHVFFFIYFCLILSFFLFVFFLHKVFLFFVFKLLVKNFVYVIYVFPLGKKAVWYGAGLRRFAKKNPPTCRFSSQGGTIYIYATVVM